MKRTSLIFIIILMSIYTVPAIAIAPAYTIIDLGTLGGTYSEAHSINDNGQIAGYSLVVEDSTRHAFYYDGSIMIDLGANGGTYSEAWSINNSGLVVGFINTDNNIYQAFLYNGISMTNFATSGASSIALDINDIGQIVGKENSTGFLYDGGTIHNLGTLGGQDSTARAINNSGQIVGDSVISDYSSRHPFLYDGMTMNDLGTLGGGFSSAYDINDNGQIVGQSNGHAFYYDGSTMYDLGTLGGTRSLAFAINEIGQIIGYSYMVGDFQKHAFLYQNARMFDLNNLIPTSSGWALERAYDINNLGQIVGYGTIGGETHAFLMNPVHQSEPISISVDIKPQTCPNPLNIESKGVLPVVVLGTDVLDVNDIDIASLEILGVSPLRSNYEDVTAPVAEEALPEDCLCTTDWPDGYMDLILKFDTQEIIEAIGAVSDGDNVVLSLTGSLTDGTPIEGSDCVLMLKKGK